MIRKFGAALGAGVVAIALVATPPVAAQVLTGDVIAGQKLAQEWCSGCHAVSPKDTQVRDNVPSFFSIANKPSSTALSLQAWLQTSHPRMPNWELTRPQIADVVAYILSLQSETLH
jgi:mono/diheme cytochrome c family protein